MSKRSKPYKACKKCRSLVEKNAEVCPTCGSKDFSDEWEGVLIVIDPERSEVAKALEIAKKGRFVIKFE
ncbi:MAG: transcription elongation factor subunit Spt4 [Desulfurococcaceae archaeon]